MKTRLTFLLVIAATLAAQAASERDPGYVAHEWGTFTSVQGADGVQLDWNPLVLWDLPKFVYDLNAVRSRRPVVVVASKLGMQCRQRMETPVIYFYTESERTVDVAVTFPEGTITEWYPQETAADLLLRPASQMAKRPALNWKGVQLVPPSSAAGKQLALRLPQDNGTSHYFAARETDAALVTSSTKGGQSEVEKFLFYRGVAGFQAPLHVTLEGPACDTLGVMNHGPEPLASLFVCEVRGGTGRMIAIGDLDAGSSRTVPLPAGAAFVPLDQLRETLGGQMRTALTRAGLYPREAAAMVKTWDAAWFGEPGLRVLYVLPRSWTDRTLPWQLTPAPRETARVMVGRAELITPAMETALTEAVQRYIGAGEGERPALVTATRQLGLGRFMEPTLRRVIASADRGPKFSALSWELLQSASQPPKRAASN
ncbi:MAG: hypothetical protein QOE70_1927 [Chthoniobacter sp.]|jgi:hypothetical protein|nr:hypothetical protein [Chthoniobacter sp.]